MRIRWTPAAAADLEQISEYLKQRHPHYREPTLRKLYDEICDLKKWPTVAVRGVKRVPVNSCFHPCHT
jgi:plasmid stabilization system protein ParE